MSLVVALCALVFTIGSFWWLNARRGRIVTSEPHAYAAYSVEELMLLRLPLVLYNTGAKAIVVQNLRIIVPGHAALPLPWRTTRSTVKPAKDDVVDLRSAIVVAGREARQVFIEFGAPLPGFILEKGEYQVVVEHMVSHRQGWKELVTFTLRVGASRGLLERYVAHDNTPELASEREQRERDAHLAALLQQLQEVSGAVGRIDL